MDTVPCTPTCCATATTTDIPGTPGDPGADGAAGQNAWSTVSADFTIPAVDANVTVAVADNNWMVVGGVVITEGPSHFQVVSKSGSTSVVLKFLGYIYDVAPGNTVSSGETIAPAGPQPFSVLTGSDSLNFGNTLAQTSADLTIAVTGAVVGDYVVLGVPNAAVNADSCYTAWVSAGDTVSVRFNNYSAAPINPAAGTFNVMVIPQ